METKEEAIKHQELIFKDLPLVTECDHEFELVKDWKTWKAERCLKCSILIQYG